jgi:hypothetical protein
MGGARVRVAGRLLDIPEGHPRVEGSDEGMAKGVRAYPLGDTRASGQSADDAGGRVAIESTAVAAHQDRTLATLALDQIQRPAATSKPPTSLRSRPTARDS